MRQVYAVANTSSLKQGLPMRNLVDMQPGDVFVYAAGSSKFGVKTRMGHACMVVDVAQNAKGEKVFILAEGNTPARDMHVMRNLTSPLRRSPWFSIDELGRHTTYISTLFCEDELVHW